MKRAFTCLVLAACGGSFKVDPVKVEPIHMTIDVNLHDASPDPARGADPHGAGRR